MDQQWQKTRQQTQCKKNNCFNFIYDFLLAELRLLFLASLPIVIEETDIPYAFI